jgi:hypothetical protein
MKMKNYNYLVFIMLLFSCNSNKPANDDDGTINVSLDMNVNQKIDISEFVDSVRFIKLETNNECLIADIRKVIFYEGLYYIHDYKTASIFVFDESGKYQFKIHKKGQGPGEYAEITHFLIDYSNKQILIYDVTMRKMIYYTLDGKFIKDINKFGDNAVIRDLILLSDGYFLCYTPDYSEGIEYCGGVWKVSPSGKPENFLWQPTIRYPIFFHFDMNYFYELPNNEVGLWCPDVNDIFRFSSNSVSKYLSMKINMKAVTDFPNMRDKKNLPSDVVKKTNVIEKDNFIITYWGNEERFHKISVYLKKENKTIVGGIDFKSDIVVPGANKHFNRTDQLLQVIYAHSAERLIEDEHYESEKNKAILKSLFSKPDDDNPALEILYLKK